LGFLVFIEMFLWMKVSVIRVATYLILSFDSYGIVNIVTSDYWFGTQTLFIHHLIVQRSIIMSVSYI
jgi:hypothetical protein